ncbi:MAG: hypothetical protein KUG81_09050 [Gammaproteobacteria bacterium]|nr:hypothetical protein [Gammaproteobacteria bacterium]
MIELGVPDVAHSVQDVVLSSQYCTLELTFNSRDSRWRFSISVDEERVFSGITIMENQAFLFRYDSDIFEGDILCLRKRQDGLPVGRDNFGVSKSYGLYYVSPSELDSFLEESS